MTLVDAAHLLAFVCSLLLVLRAADLLVVAVEAAGDRYSWPPGLVGLLAAVGADGPEVSSSAIALFNGAPDVGLGVILGSNLFNLAALLGLPVLLVGFVSVQRYGLLLNGAVMLVTTALAAALIAGALPVPLVEAGAAVVLAVYAVLLMVPRRDILSHVPVSLEEPAGAAGDGESEERAREQETDSAAGFPSAHRILGQAVLATALVIGGCDVLVNSTLYLSGRAALPATFTGTFVLATLTSLPNLWVAVSLARRHRGAVLVSAACNSNTINAVFGVCVPALFHTPHASPVVRDLDVPALLLLTVLVVWLVWRGKGLGRAGGSLIVLAYIVFVVLRLALTPSAS